ncbi:MAG: hypothetical protein WCN95_02360 [bacterium]
MKARSMIVAGLILVAATVGQRAVADPHRLGAGVHYNASVTSLGDGFDSSGLSYLISYQFVPASFFKLEANVEILPSSLTGSETAYVPQVYALLGGIIYGGLGIGVAYSDGEFAKDPIYNIRAGLDIPISKIHIDVNANYGFTDFDQLSDLNSDNITIGLLARYEF